MRWLRSLVVVVVGLLGTGELAQAYVLPTEFILKLLAERRERLGIRDLSAQLNVELGAAGTLVDERWYLKDPSRSRRVRQNEDVTTVEVQREGKLARGTETALKAVKGPIEDLLPALLFPGGDDLDQREARMLAAIKALGINTAVTALGRHEKTVCYIIGARSYEPDLPQLWVEKETLLPLRLILQRQVEGKKVRREIRWLEFTSSTTGEWFPRIIEVLENGVRLERAEVEKIEINTKIPETFFDIP